MGDRRAPRPVDRQQIKPQPPPAPPVMAGSINVATRRSTRNQSFRTRRMLEAAARDAPIPSEWIDLFLLMADVVDGVGFSPEYQEMLREAYQTIFETPLGQRIYGRMVDAGAELLAGKR